VIESMPLIDPIQRLREVIGSPRDPAGRGFVSLAECLFEAGEAKDALAVLEEGLHRHPELAPAHLVQARILSAQGDLEGARESFDRLRALDPHHPDLPLASHRPNPPQPSAPRAAPPPRPSGERSPSLPPTRTLADLYDRQGLVVEALAAYRVLLEASPEDAGLRARIEALEEALAEVSAEAPPSPPAPTPSSRANAQDPFAELESFDDWVRRLSP
jgi:tetratricopeptide (TPR) repeat protein